MTLVASGRSLPPGAGEGQDGGDRPPTLCTNLVWTDLVVGSLGRRYVPGVLGGLWLVATTLPHGQGRIFRKGQIRLRPQTPVEDAASPCLPALHMLTGRTQTWMGSCVVRHMPCCKAGRHCCLDDTYHDTDKHIIIQLYHDTRGERHNEPLYHAARQRRAPCLRHCASESSIVTCYRRGRVRLAPRRHTPAQAVPAPHEAASRSTERLDTTTCRSLT
jgi:hypothetical protein